MPIKLETNQAPPVECMPTRFKMMAAQMTAATNPAAAERQGKPRGARTFLSFLIFPSSVGRLDGEMMTQAGAAAIRLNLATKGKNG